MKLNEPDLQDDFNQAYLQMTVDNWQSIFETFIEKWHKAPSAYESYLVRTYAARLLERVYDLYEFENTSPSRLLEEFSVLVSNMGEAALFIKKSNDPIQLPKKRLPSLEESVGATLRRLDTMQELVRILGPGLKGVIMGGSMAYGPFLNVRSNLFSSDVDVVAIAERSFFENQTNSLEVNNIYIDNEEWKLFLSRKKIFLKLHDTGKADILSQRFTIKDQDHSVSIHFFPPEVFEEVYKTQLEPVNLLNDYQHVVKDYKNTKYEKIACQLRNFSGEEVDYFPISTEVEAGFVVGLPSSGMRSGRFFPGFYHQIIMPARRILLDSRGDVGEKVVESVSLMKQRVFTESKNWPMASFLKSHPRHPVFAPNKYKDWDA